MKLSLQYLFLDENNCLYNRKVMLYYDTILAIKMSPFK